MRMGGGGLVVNDNNDNVAFFREINFTKISVCKGARGGIITRAPRASKIYFFESLSFALFFSYFYNNSK